MFYLRAFIRLGALPVDNLALIEAQQSTGATNGDGVFVTSTGLTLFSQFSEKSRDANFVPTVDAWTCVVWNVVRATDSSGSLTLAGDATDAIDERADRRQPRRSTSWASGSSSPTRPTRRPSRRSTRGSTT